MKKLIWVFVISLGLLSCKNDDDFIGNINTPVASVTDEEFAQDNFGNSINTNFIGRIVNQDGNKLKDVQVTIGNQTTLTDHNGVFVLNNVSVYEKFAFIKATKNGYIQGSRSIVPTPNGTNDVQITLLEKNIIATVNSGEASEVSLPNGAKVSFQGDFIDGLGNPYSGQVAVSVHYLQPNQTSTFAQMPGMLFGQRENGAASSMETYGMLGVNLFSSNGEQLNIKETSPAIVRFPVATSTPNAPEVINLWFFDELTGYWKEQGQALRVGDEYVAEVTHFTWWNCDLPLDYVEVCFTVRSHDDLTNCYIDIIRNETNQVIFSGYTNDQGQECGLFPSDEELTVNVYGTGACINSIVHTQTIGPYTNDMSIDIIVPSLPSQLIETTLTGTVSTCTGTSVTNGYVFLYNSNSTNFSDYEIISITDGTINYPFSYCNGEQYSMIVYDLYSNQSSGVSQIIVTPTEINVGTVLVCGNQIGGVYAGDVLLTSQAEVDTFGLLGYTEITGGLSIGDYNNLSNYTDITDLTTLSSLTKVQGLAVTNNPNLVSLQGFENVIEVNNWLYIRNNNSLISVNGLSGLTALNGAITVLSNESLESFELTANAIASDLMINENSNLTSIQLSNLTTVSGFFHFSENLKMISIGEFNSLTTIGDDLSVSGNTMLNSLNGLNNLTNIEGYLSIIGNESLVSLEGLNNVTLVGGYMIVESNSELVSLIDLSNLTSVGGYMIIDYNESLISLEGLDNLSTLNSWSLIGNNSALTSLQGLNNLTTIGVHLEVSSNESLSSIEALANLSSIGGLYINNNGVLTSLNGLQGIGFINGTLSISNNGLLNTLSGLNNLTSVNGSVHIVNNDSLINLTGLNSFETNTTNTGGGFYITENDLLTSLGGLENLTSVYRIRIGVNSVAAGSSAPNPNLTNLCALQNLFTNGTHTYVSIANNAYNPTVQNIIDGNCSQ